MTGLWQNCNSVKTDPTKSVFYILRSPCMKIQSGSIRNRYSLWLHGAIIMLLTNIYILASVKLYSHWLRNKSYCDSKTMSSTLLSFRWNIPERCLHVKSCCVCKSCKQITLQRSVTTMLINWIYWLMQSEIHRCIFLCSLKMNC